VLEAGLHWYSAEWDNLLPQPAGDAGLDAPQDTAGPLATLGTLVSLAINPTPQISFCGAALQPLGPQFVRLTRITLSHVENSAIALVKFHT